MTKTGKPDSYWASILHQYAQGKYKFTTGKKPGARKWKAVMKRIDTCPLTPVFNQRPREYTIFGKKILCQCGYHKSAEQAGSSGSQQTEGESGSIAGRPQTAPATQSSSAASATQSSSAASATQSSSAASATQSSSDAPTMQSSWSRSAARATQSSSAAFATQSSWSRSATSATQSRSAAPATQSSLSASRQTAAQIKCALCSIDISGDKFSEHLSDFHTDECCEQCGRKVSGAVGLLHHIEEHHHKLSKQPQLPCPPPPQQPPPPSRQQPPFPPPQQPPPPPPPTSPHVIILRPPEVNWVSFLPKQFMRVIQPADREWIAQCLYDPAGQLKQQLSQNWFHPPNPPKPATTLPDPMTYFRQRMFLWAPMRMWGIPLKCHQCNTKMHHSGIYTKVREVIDLDSRYYLVGGDYPRCSKCMIPVCPWSTEMLSQLDPAHRNRFPAVLTTQLALDRKCVTMLKPRTAGNSSSYMQQALEEVHSEEWARRTIHYLSDCELHQRRSAITHCDEAAVYLQPPPFRPLPLAQWFETVHANEILGHLDEMKGVITSTYGRVLKLDSTKKITKKLAGDIADTATWMTNVSNEIGQVLNCVLTTGEGSGLDELCQGIVKRYKDAGEPEPEVLYVDRDCCSETGV
ncbi:uncharacterized protein LOC119498739 [Sebastes umbrosus]|uniref:uncharacterized protein LOC119498713 n=1 Tax=Sebastes umbrosus TaxID=72105 RepID=UPI00189EBB48|nr:uncharacterized protein LOC119498713 [Sebastes umbrosus]XP_037643715.1 uncharacterized protein LOC119498739 [Sebastes umbrosus]